MECYRLFAGVILVASSFLLLAEVPAPIVHQSPKNQGQSVLHLDWMDETILPSQNFYAYANGHWQEEILFRKPTRVGIISVFCKKQWKKNLTR